MLQLNNKKKIEEITNKNIFGVSLQTTKSIEEIQDNSGMSGSYKLEYQVHYWSLVGRMEQDGQKFDISIPMVFFNYPQEVNGAHIDTDLEEITEASESNSELADQKIEEFQKTEMYKWLYEVLGFETWQKIPMSSIHCHPGGVNSFSSTDLMTNPEYPGIVYPHDEGTDIPSMSGIMQHKSNFSEIIYNQYRIFNGKDGHRKYEHGRCLTIIKGYDSPTIEQEPIKDGIFDQLFGTHRPQPPKITNKDRKNKILKYGFTGNEGKDVGEEILSQWSECDFEPDTTQVFPENIIEEKSHQKVYGRDKKNKKSHKVEYKYGSDYMEPDLFSYSSHRNKDKKIIKHLNLSKEQNSMMNDLLRIGYAYNDTQSMTIDELEEIWNEEFIDQPIMDERQVNYMEQTSSMDSTADFMRGILIHQNIISEEKSKMMSDKHVEFLYEQIIEGEQDAI